MSIQQVCVALAWSIGTAVLAALDGWLVTNLALSWDLPIEATVVLAVVAMGLTCLLGCRFAASRFRAPRALAVALVVSFPALLGLLNATASTGPAWFRWLGIVLVLGGALVGAWTAPDPAARSATDRRFSAQR